MQQFWWSPLVLSFPSSFINSSVTVPRAPITSLSCSTVFQFSSKVEVLTFLFTFFQFYSVVNRDCEVHNSVSSLFFFLIDYYEVWSSGHGLYVKILYEFVCLILQERCWVVHIPLVRIVKLKFPAQFPVDHLAHPSRI